MKKRGRRAAQKSSEKTGSDESAFESPQAVRKVAERLLVDLSDEITGGRIACTSVASAQAAAAVAQAHQDAAVSCLLLDVYISDLARRQWREIENLQIDCRADFDVEPVDTFVLPFSAAGSSELTRDLLQAAHQRLKPEGRVFASSDNTRDHWLHEQLQGLFGKVTQREADGGKVYIAARPKPSPRLRSFECWFAFRDQERLIHTFSRPGVFSHRRLDLGARALIESLTVSDEDSSLQVIKSGARVLEIGSGCGAIGFAAALRADGVHVHAVDSNARAVQATEMGAERNEINGLTTQLVADGRCDNPGSYDVVLASPPQFSNETIGKIFATAARYAVRPGGRIHFVTKQAEWFADRFVEDFDEVSVREVRGYFIVKGTGRNSR